MKSFAWLLLFIALFTVCGCSVQGKGVEVYFFNNENKLVSVDRELPTLENPGVIAMDQLMKGPSEQESAGGLSTAIPAGTRARQVEINGDVAIVDFNESLLQVGDAASIQRMLAQIIYTATSVRGVKKVLIKLEGSDNFTLGDGYVIDHPLERSDVKI